MSDDKIAMTAAAESTGLQITDAEWDILVPATVDLRAGLQRLVSALDRETPPAFRVAVGVEEQR